jgi:hypothetical protein
VGQIKVLYPDRGSAAAPRLSPACSALPAKLFAVKDTDWVWNDPASWVWREQPIFANRYVRLFQCGAAPTQARLLVP